MNLISILSDMDLHDPGPDVVNVSVISFLEISLTVGTYFAFKSVAEGLKDPFPLVVHVPLAPFKILPDKGIEVASEHTSKSLPAKTSGALLILTIMLLDTALHVPAFIVFKEKLNEDLAVSVEEK